MAESLRILILEDNPSDAELVQFELAEAGLTFASKVVVTENDFIGALHEFSPDLILSDYDLPRYNGVLALAEARRRCPDTPFILVTGAVTEDRAIEILTQGAKDYVLKHRIEQRLAPAVRRALAEAGEQKARKKAEAELHEAHRTLEERVRIRTAELEAEIEVRKRVEEALRDSEERLNLAVQGAGMGTWDVDLRTARAVWSRTHFEIFGYPPNENGEATLEMWRSRVHPDDLDGVNRAFDTARTTGSVYAPEYRIIRANNGEVRWVSAFGRFLRNDAGEVVRFVGILFDNTAHKTAEEELRKANDEWARFNRAAVGRELRLIELKREVNRLCAQTGQAPRYTLDFGDEQP